MSPSTGSRRYRAKRVNDGSEPILSVRALRRFFPIRNAFGIRVRWLKALEDVSFDVRHGDILGVVGESGCGKSTLGKTLIGIHLPMSGEVWFQGREIARLTPGQRRDTAKSLQYVYQDPGASLDPRWKIGRSLNEPLIVHTALSAEERMQRVRDILKAVGLPAGHLDLYPHELSGGQQRRVGLARILTLQPTLVILDEPTSGLDVSVQATVLNLIRDLQATFDLTYLFISHDLSVVQAMCNRIIVMYLGKIVETGDTDQIFNSPRHPYTQSLLAAIPKIGADRVTDGFSLEGEPPDPGNLPNGCRFRTRCPVAAQRCEIEEPPLVPGRGNHAVACHFA